MFYSHYRGRCVGRLIGVVERYAGLGVADYATYGSGEIRFHGLWATYVWDGDTDVPVLTFKSDSNEDQWLERKQEYWRPLLDDPMCAYSNVEYIIQEIGKLRSPSDAEVGELLKKHGRFDDEKRAELIPHFHRCGSISRHYYDWWNGSIERDGFARPGQYPGMPKELLLPVRPEAPLKEVVVPPRPTFHQMMERLTKA